MGRRQMVTNAMALRYRAAGKDRKNAILTELCLRTGWHRDHARKQLRAALDPKAVTRQRRRPRSPSYSAEVFEALRTVWLALGTPSGKRLAPFLPEAVARLRACGELDIDDRTAAKLSALSAATIDRRLADDRKRLRPDAASLSPARLPRPTDERERLLLNEIHAKLRLHQNFFSPRQQLVAKHRAGTKVVRRYDTARTPYQRLLDNPNVPQHAKAALTRRYHELNPAQLRRDILALADQLTDPERRRLRPPMLLWADTVETQCPRDQLSPVAPGR